VYGINDEIRDAGRRIHGMNGQIRKAGKLAHAMNCEIRDAGRPVDDGSVGKHGIEPPTCRSWCRAGGGNHARPWCGKQSNLILSCSSEYVRTLASTSWIGFGI